VKFTQFVIAEEPDVRRTGMAYEGKFYETDGVNAIAVHEASDVRLLTPINRPWSVRFFGADSPDFAYANPHSMFGPSEPLQLMHGVDNVVVVPCLGFVIGGVGGMLHPREADDLILGLTLVNSYRTDEPGARALDLGFSVGPIIVTPDEFDDAVTADAKGRRYRTSMTLRMNSVETQTLSLADLKFNPAELAAYASLTCNVREGDLLAIELTEPVKVDRGDEFALIGEKIGVLTNRLV
jgi:2-keto-4-pentenoate hydratase/2-oxohepta-3-ene-1,7-dioic acid hydratase in catechol pathway